MLTVSIASGNPNWTGTGQTQADYIQVCPASGSCPLGSGRDTSNYGGPAKVVTCTSSLLTLPALHD